MAAQLRGKFGESLVSQGYYLPDYVSTTFVSCDVEIHGHYSGIGGLPSTVATVYHITTYGYTSDRLQQKVSGLTTFDYKHDHFTITWKRYD
jgi:hypothetical protein